LSSSDTSVPRQKTLLDKPAVAPKRLAWYIFNGPLNAGPGRLSTGPQL
jgi:hypothetical protein